MGDMVRVDTGSLGRTRDSISGLIRQIRAQVKAMSNDAAALGGMWEGEAHTTFDRQLKNDVAKLDSLCAKLEGIVSYEGNALTEYNRCEQKVSGLISSIRV